MSKVAEQIAAAVLDRLAAILGGAQAEAVWRSVLTQRLRSQPRGNTDKFLSFVWSVYKDNPTVSKRSLFKSIEEFAGSRGHGRGKGSIGRSLYRHWPAYRQRKEAERQRLGSFADNRLLTWGKRNEQLEFLSAVIQLALAREEEISVTPPDDTSPAPKGHHVNTLA